MQIIESTIQWFTNSWSITNKTCLLTSGVGKGVGKGVGNGVTGASVVGAGVVGFGRIDKCTKGLSQSSIVNFINE